MEATAATPESTLELDWTDPKRYLWLLGLIVPLAPFIAWGFVEATGLGLLWWFGPVVRLRAHPVPRHADRQGLGQPARQRAQVARGGPLLPLVHLRLHPAPVRGAGLRLLACGPTAASRFLESLGLALTVAMVGGIAINTAHELGHKRKKLREVAVEGRARADRLRPLLHRAQPRPPRARRDARGPGQLAPRRELLASSSRARSGAACTSALASREASASTGSASRSSRSHNDILNAWAMTRRAVRRADRDLRHRGRCRGWRSRRSSASRCSRSSTTSSTTACCARSSEDGRYERCRPEHSWNSDNVASNVFLYHLQRHSDHHAHPTRRYQALRHFEDAAGAALRLRDDDPARLRDAALAPGDGPEGARPLRRRRHARRTSCRASGRRCSPATAPARQPRRASADGDSLQCPECEYVYDEDTGEPREGFPAGDAVDRSPGRLDLPRLRRARQGGLRAARGGRVSAAPQPPRAGRRSLRPRAPCCARPSSTPSTTCSPSTRGRM